MSKTRVTIEISIVCIANYEESGWKAKTFVEDVIKWFLSICMEIQYFTLHTSLLSYHFSDGFLEVFWNIRQIYRPSQKARGVGTQRVRFCFRPLIEAL